jgi:flagellar assembly protein FliH
MNMSEKFQFDSFPTPGYAWRRWEMATFDIAEPDVHSTGQAAPARVDPAVELEQLRTAVSQQAHEQGFAAGRMEGIAAGRPQGLAQGQKEGYEAGFAQGLTLGRERAQDGVAQLERVMSACADAVSGIEKEVGQALVNLAVSIAEQVLRSTLSNEPERILDIVRDIVRIQADNEVVVILRVNPADLSLLEEFLSGEPGLKNWQLAADESIERGGCMAETPLGNIDATLQTRWQRAAASLGAR